MTLDTPRQRFLAYLRAHQRCQLEGAREVQETIDAIMGMRDCEVCRQFGDLYLEKDGVYFCSGKCLEIWLRR